MKDRVPGKKAKKNLRGNRHNARSKRQRGRERESETEREETSGR